MLGTNKSTGKPLDGLDHLRQSIHDILTTPIGSRVMRRDYGSNLFKLIDAPMNRGTILQLFAATAQAIAKWEPRFAVEKVSIVEATPGAVTIDVTGLYKPDGKTITLDGIVVK